MNEKLTMNSTSSLKVTVNGKKYLITGIQRETSCKDLLCAIAKVTPASLTLYKDDKKGEEKSLRGLYGVKTSEIKHDENLLEKFKGDRKSAGDLKSLQIFNSLGKNAKIIAKDDTKATRDKDVGGENEHSQNYKKRKKKTKIKEEKKKKTHENKERKSSKHKQSKKQEFEINEKPRKSKHRSVDDSDLDSYKRDPVERLKKRRSRVRDDSDLDVYQNLFDIVLNQTKTLQKLQSQSKEVRKSAWIKELQKSSQVYHFLADGENADTNINESEMNSIEKDDGNDSGLPSPEYDSSESHENQPIDIVETLSHDQVNKKEQEHDQSVKNCGDDFLKENVTVDKQSLILNQNILDKNSNNKIQDNLPNGKSNRCDTKQNSREQNKASINETKTDQTKSDKQEILAKVKNKTLLTEDLEGRQEESENLMSTVSILTEKNPLNNKLVEHIKSNGFSIDHNKNVIALSKEDIASRKMVAFDVALLKQRAVANSAKKADKKRIIKKTDISDPVLLSPNTFKKQRSLKKVESVLGVANADVLRNETVLFQSKQTAAKTNNQEKDKKEKEKFYNKKLKEIRKVKKEKKNDPEYTPKFCFEDEDEEEVQEILELNVFEKKKKNKQKNKKMKTDEPKIKQKNEIDNKPEKNSSAISNNSTPQENLERSSKSNVNNKNKNDLKNNNRKTAQLLLPTPGNQNKQELDRNLYLEHDEYLTPSSEANQNITNKHNDLKAIDENNTEIKSLKENNEELESSTKTTELLANTDLFTQTNCPSSMTNKASNSNINDSTVGEIDDTERAEMILQYQKEKQALDYVMEKLLDYNLLIYQLSQDLEILSNEQVFEETDEDLDIEERNIYNGIESVKSLLRSVADLTSYQRKEMAENLAHLDRLDLDARVKKAGYENLKNGVWKTNSQAAPRWLIKKRNALQGVNSNREQGSSFV